MWGSVVSLCWNSSLCKHRQSIAKVASSFVSVIIAIDASHIGPAKLEWCSAGKTALNKFSLFRISATFLCLSETSWGLFISIHLANDWQRASHVRGLGAFSWDVCVAVFTLRAPYALLSPRVVAAPLIRFCGPLVIGITRLLTGPVVWNWLQLPASLYSLRIMFVLLETDSPRNQSAIP